LPAGLLGLLAGLVDGDLSPPDEAGDADPESDDADDDEEEPDADPESDDEAGVDAAGAVELPFRLSVR
jgi:hypothetical protein